MAVIHREASTRPAALMRIGLVLLLWHRVGQDLAPFSGTHPERLALGVVFWIASSLAFVGLYTRAAMGVLATTMVVGFYGFSIDKIDGFEARLNWESHHMFLMVMATVLLALAPTGRSFSVDRWRAQPEAPPERGPQWAITLLAVQLSAIYFWSAVDKTTLAFLSGERLDAIAVHFYLANSPESALWPWALGAAACITVILEYLLPFGLFVRRLQPVLIPMGLVLHGLFYVAIPVGPFSAEMMLFYLAYLDPDSVHRAIDRMVATDTAAPTT
jgi:hypothetical protein